MSWLRNMDEVMDDAGLSARVRDLLALMDARRNPIVLGDASNAIENARMNGDVERVDAIRSAVILGAALRDADMDDMGVVDSMPIPTARGRRNVLALLSRGPDWLVSMLGAFSGTLHGLGHMEDDASDCYNPIHCLTMFTSLAIDAMPSPRPQSPDAFGRSLARSWGDLLDHGRNAATAYAFPSMGQLRTWEHAVVSGGDIPMCASTMNAMTWLLGMEITDMDGESYQTALSWRDVPDDDLRDSLVAAVSSDGRRDYSAVARMTRSGHGLPMPDGGLNDIVDNGWLGSDFTPTPAQTLGLLDVEDVLVAADGHGDPSCPDGPMPWMGSASNSGIIAPSLRCDPNGGRHMVDASVVLHIIDFLERYPKDMIVEDPLLYERMD